MAHWRVPPLEAEPWPTLGPELCDWLEASLCHGPGDVLGLPLRLTDEARLFVYRAYEVYPRGHAMAGRRRFKRVVLCRRKGWAKTELAALLAIAELDPGAPVRCDGWAPRGGEWVPVGRAVRDPYIPMVAVTEEQTEDLAYAAAREILGRCALAPDYLVTYDRITHRSEPGRMQALASAPGAREGARTTFQHFDETMLFLSDRLRRSHTTMLRNVPKRRAADPWSLETTTAYEPGADSVAEGSHRYAEDVAEGRIADARLYYDHLQASAAHDLGRPRGLLAAVQEASGDAWAWCDADSVVAQYHDPQADEADFRRYWLNQPVRSSRRWAPAASWGQLAAPRAVPAPSGVPVVLAFDGSYSRDSTALVGCTVEAQPYIWLEGCWERPPGATRWRAPRLEVLAAVEAAMEGYEVVELAPDPPGWHAEVELWEEAYGATVVRFETNQPRRMGPACDDFEQACADAQLQHDGSPVFARHLEHCVPRQRGAYTLVTKDDPDSPHKIDAAVGAILAHHRARWHYAHQQEDDEVGGILVDLPGGVAVP